MRRSNASGVLQYVPELTWMLFLRILDEREELEALESEAVGISFTPSLSYPYRWRGCAGYSRRTSVANIRRTGTQGRYSDPVTRFGYNPVMFQMGVILTTSLAGGAHPWISSSESSGLF